MVDRCTGDRSPTQGCESSRSITLLARNTGYEKDEGHYKYHQNETLLPQPLMVFRRPNEVGCQSVGLVGIFLRSS